MQYSEKNQKEFFEKWGQFVEEIYALYWRTEEYDNPNKNSITKTLKCYAYKVQDIADRFGIPKAQIVRCLLSRKTGPSMGKCPFCEKESFAQNRSEYQSSWINNHQNCGCSGICPCGNGILKYYEKRCRSCLAKINWEKDKNKKSKDEDRSEIEISPDQQDGNFNGPFIRAYIINDRQITHKFYYIKITEIKQIEDQEKNCSFYTYKDSRYYVYVSRNELIKAINMFLFKPEEFSKLYVTW